MSRDSRSGSSPYFPAQGPPPAAAGAAAGKQAPISASPAAPGAAPAVQHPVGHQGQAVAAQLPPARGPDPAPAVELVRPAQLREHLPLADDAGDLDDLLRQARGGAPRREAAAAAPPVVPQHHGPLTDQELAQLRLLLGRPQAPAAPDNADPQELIGAVLAMWSSSSYAEVVSDFRDQVLRCAASAPSLPEGCKWSSVKPAGLRGDLPLDVVSKLIDGVNIYSRSLLVELNGDQIDIEQVVLIAAGALRFVRELIRHQLMVVKAAGDAGGAGKVIRDALGKVFDPHRPATIQDAQAELGLQQQALQIEALQAKIAARKRSGNGGRRGGGGSGGNGGGRGGGNTGHHYNGNNPRRGGRGGHNRTDNSSSGGSNSPGPTGPQ